MFILLAKGLPSRAVACILTIALSSCSQVIYHQQEASDEGDGIRYYHSSPYLLVYSNGKGGVVTEILYIADPFKKVSATPKMFLSNLELTMEFDHGVLSKSTNDLDATSVPSAVLKAIETAAPAFLAAANDPGNEREVPGPYLYKIVVLSNEIFFIGGKADQNIKVNILPQENTKP